VRTEGRMVSGYEGRGTVNSVLTISHRSCKVYFTSVHVCSCMQTEARAPERGGNPPESHGRAPSSCRRYFILWWTKLLVEDREVLNTFLCTVPSEEPSSPSNKDYASRVEELQLKVPLRLKLMPPEYMHWPAYNLFVL